MISLLTALSGAHLAQDAHVLVSKTLVQLEHVLPPLAPHHLPKVEDDLMV